jgi:AcrR family transcriptional regulator
MRKPNWRTARGDSSRDDILDVASQIMSSHGYDGTSIAALCQATGLNVSSIYWHFGSKSGVLAALMERGAQRFLHSLEEVLSRAPQRQSARARLRWVMARFCETFADNREFMRLLIALLINHGDDATLAVVQRVRAQGRECVRRQIEMAFSTGREAFSRRVAVAISEQFADYAIAQVEGAFLAREANPALPFETLMAQLADAVACLGESRGRARVPSPGARHKTAARHRAAGK